MYKLLLCCRYLRTRWIALASVISVTLGVATMIVVNSVMAGFTHEMQGRIHGILSDIVFETHGINGFHDPERHMQKIREVAGDYIAGMTPTVVVPAMLVLDYNGQFVPRPIQIIGIDETTHEHVSDFGRYLQHPANRKQLSFDLREGDYDVYDHQAGAEAIKREEMVNAGWGYRRNRARYQAEHEAMEAERRALEAKLKAKQLGPPQTGEASAEATAETTTEPAAETATTISGPSNPFATAAPSGEAKFDPAKQQHTGVVLGFALASYRMRDGSDRFLVMPGDDVKITVPSSGMPPEPISAEFTVVDLYESKMSEYDANFVFVPIRKLQEMRGMIDPTTQIGSVTSIQIKLHNDADGKKVRDLLQAAFPPEIYSVQTWRDKQGPLLAAAHIETIILNILLFLIIAVAGFGILAIFFMIVVEKTRDIGILKSLGASSTGIMGIFLGYGLSLGLVGSGVGLILGLLFVENINSIADVVAWVTGQELFDPSIYYFQEIPTIVKPFTLTWIVSGALLIAVLASVLPALRAASLHPVRALRYE
jgi:lipoprotein-releasing system permease protein